MAGGCRRTSGDLGSPGYHEDSGTLSTPETADIVDIFGVDVTPLVSGVDATSGPDLSIVASISVDPGAYYTYADTDDGGSIRNPSIVSSSSLSLQSRPSPMICDSVRCRRAVTHRFDWGLWQGLTDEFIQLLRPA